MNKMFFLATLLEVVALVACSSRPGRSDGNDAGIAAVIGDRTVTMQELDDHWRALEPAEHDQAMQALYNGRRTALGDIVAASLIEEAAKVRDLGAAAFVESEIARRTTPVTDADVAAFYEKNARQMQGRSLEQMTAAIHEYLTDDQRAAAHQALVAQLRMTGPKVRALFAPPRREVPVSNADPSDGDPSAPVTIVEFSDFQCPFCQRVAPTLAQIRARYGDNVRVVWKDFPLTQIHSRAFKAAEAAHCAGEQGKYWNYHDRLFANQQSLDVADLKSYAAALGLNAAKFGECLDTERHAERVRAGIAQGTKLGVSSTPTLYINGRAFSGAQPFEVLASVIDEELSEN
jgi:protein-disulfide isomerase